MKTLISGLIARIAVSLCCNTTKNIPQKPEECNPYENDPYSIASITPTKNEYQDKKDKQLVN